MKLTLVDKKTVAPDTTSFIFRPEAEFTWQAGQFIKYRLDNPTPDERHQDRFFTISTAPFEKNLMLTTRFTANKSSTFKKDLQNLPVGNVIQAQGPSGNFILENPNQKYVFIAGGIGITPFRSILLEMAHQNQPINVILLYANKTADFVFKDELEKLKQTNPDFRIEYFVDPARIDQNSIKQKVFDFNDRLFYVSGPEPMVEGTLDILEKMGLGKDNIKRDYFPGYNWP